MNKKRILIISYLSPPAATPRAIRLEALATHWKNAGYIIDIVSYGNNVRETTSYGDNYRVTSSILKRLAAHNNVTSKTVVSSKTFKSTVFSVLSKLWWKVFAWPDGNCLWIFPAIKKMKELMKSKQYDAVLSVSTPFSGHIVAQSVLRKHKDILWIADNGDPFSLVPESPYNNYYFYSCLNKFSERKILSQCNYFSVTTEGTKKLYADAFPEYAQKIVVIPPLFNGNVPNQLCVEEVQKYNNGIINIVFIGLLYKKMRNPSNALDIFIRLFDKYPKLRTQCKITFYGSLGDCQDIFEKYTSKIPLYFEGLLKHSDVMNTMLRSSVLLNLGNITSFQTPSKIIEYALSGRPVLNVASISNDSTVPYFINDKTFLNVDGFKNISEKELETIAEFILSSAGISREKKIINTIWQNHSIEKIASQYSTLLT